MITRYAHTLRRLMVGLLVGMISFSLGVCIVLTNRSSYRSLPTVSKPLTVTAGRNLSQYDLGGRQGCGMVAKSEVQRCEDSMKTARDFIWSHWHDRRRGYVIVKLTGIDAESDAHIFIEPDETGTWHIAWTGERIFAISMSRDVSGEIFNMPDI